MLEKICAILVMARLLTRRQALENTLFLEVLAQTGNARLAARRLGVHRSTYTKRRAKCAAFAARWEAALASAHSGFEEEGGAALPDAAFFAEDGELRSPLLSLGAEETVVRTASGRLQLRLAPPGRLTARGWDLVLRTIAGTNNLRRAAWAAGVAHTSLFARASAHPAAAREIAAARVESAKRIKNLNAPYWPRGLTIAQALCTLRRLGSSCR